jgi:hypothetical protein
LSISVGSGCKGDVTFFTTTTVLGGTYVEKVVGSPFSFVVVTNFVEPGITDVNVVMNVVNDGAFPSPPLLGKLVIVSSGTVIVGNSPVL